MVALIRWITVALLILLAVNVAGGSLQQESPLLQGSGNTSATVNAEDIVSKIEAGQPVNLSSVIISGELDLSNLSGDVRQPVKIINSTFLRAANFQDVTFDEAVDLRGNNFQGDLNFNTVQFLMDSNFAGSRFYGNIDFRSVKFNGLVSFAGSEFFQDVSFAYAQFGRAANFANVEFDGNISFANAQFSGDAGFDGATFSNEADFDFVQFSRLVTFYAARFLGETSFSNAVFVGTSNFISSPFSGNVSFAGAKFDSDAFFRSADFHHASIFGGANFGGFSDFTGARFRGAAIFALTKFSDNSYFVGAVFNNDLILESSRIYSMQLDNTTFGQNSKITLRDADFNRLIIRWNKIKDHLVFDGAAYQALVKNYRNLEWFDDADDCYFEYRWISQSQEDWGWMKVADIIAWISCGYGVRVSYVSLDCLLTVLFFGLIYWAGNGMRRFELSGREVPGDADDTNDSRTSLTDAMYFSLAMFTTSQAPYYNYPVGFYRHLAMFEGILGWFFLGLFVVVLSGVLIR